VRVGVARRLRAVAVRIEPVGNVPNAEPSTVAVDRQDAA
jgi:CHAD domain-containing protein